MKSSRSSLVKTPTNTPAAFSGFDATAGQCFHSASIMLMWAQAGKQSGLPGAKSQDSIEA